MEGSTMQDSTVGSADTPPLSFIPYPPIERHGLIGDRRTAALVAADGTIDWLCLPDYDGPNVFGTLLDAEHGGYWRLGPATPDLGRQRYRDDSAVLVTSWTTNTGELELTDALAWPHQDRPQGGRSTASSCAVCAARGVRRTGSWRFGAGTTSMRHQCIELPSVFS